ILRAQVHQSGKAAYARHREIEKDQIDFAAAIENARDLFERAGLGDLHLRIEARDRFAQCAAEQRVIVRDHQTILGRLAQDLLSRTCPCAREGSITATRYHAPYDTSANASEGRGGRPKPLVSPPIG